jgi:TPR repeat protein
MRSAEQGYAPAEARLGVLYTQGKGVTQDNLKAYFWLTLATKQNLRIAERLRNQVLAKLAQDDVTKIEMDVSKWRPKVSPVKNATIAH